MDIFFPIGYPWPTTFYLTLYVLTLLLHVVPMNYVLAGSTYWAATACFAKPEHAATGRNPLSQLLRDWMPFALGIAITAAIAPLLFLQLLYKHFFYTANLLLFHRWMSILPVLILAFYLLYLRKAKGVDRWPLAFRIGIALAAGVCFLFVAWSWTENHLLGLAQDQWAEQYASGRLVYWSREQLPRLAVWYVGAFPTLAVLLGWQVQFHLRRGTPWPDSPVPRLLRIALAALLASALAALVYFLSLNANTRGALLRDGGAFYVGLAFVGWACVLDQVLKQDKDGRCNGTRFVVRVDGKQVFARDQKPGHWLPVVISLDDHAGKTIKLQLATNAINANTNYDWAYWGDPRIMLLPGGGDVGVDPVAGLAATSSR